MGCAMGIVKYVVFIFNLVFALAGLALLIVGVLYKLDMTAFTDAIPEQYDSLELVPTLLIIVGCIVFVIAFFGCCGAVRESTCMLTTYAIILLTIFILQVAIGVFAFLQINDEEDLKKELRQGLLNSFSNYGANPVATETVDVIQQRLECCGFNTPADIRFGNGSYPSSCCPENSGACESAYTFNRGCWNQFYEAVIQAIKVIGIVAISLAVTEIIGAIVALCLASSIRNNYRRGAYA